MNKEKQENLQSGGGRDVVSALLVKVELKRKFLVVEVKGMVELNCLSS
jgi:hypothetical protein